MFIALSVLAKSVKQTVMAVQLAKDHEIGFAQLRIVLLIFEISFFVIKPIDINNLTLNLHGSNKDLKIVIKWNVF